MPGCVRRLGTSSAPAGKTSHLLHDRTVPLLGSLSGRSHSATVTHTASIVPPEATTIYSGGHNAVDGEAELIGEGDPVTQTKEVMSNLDGPTPSLPRPWPEPR